MGPFVFRLGRLADREESCGTRRLVSCFLHLQPVVSDPGRLSKGSFLGLITAGDTGECQACPQKGKTVAVSRPSKGKEPALLAVDPRRGRLLGPVAEAGCVAGLPPPSPRGPP